jgi:fibrillarin-like pre-rRNA processing protein
LFLKEKGWTMLTVKSRSIDVTRKPTEIYDQEGEVLRDRGFVIQEIVQLDPYDKDHALIVSKI